MVATMGFKSQILANFSARLISMLPPDGERRIRTSSHPATMSATLKRILPKENQKVPGHVVGSSSQARRGV